MSLKEDLERLASARAAESRRDAFEMAARRVDALSLELHKAHLDNSWWLVDLADKAAKDIRAMADTSAEATLSQREAALLEAARLVVKWWGLLPDEEVVMAGGPQAEAAMALHGALAAYAYDGTKACNCGADDDPQDARLPHKTWCKVNE